MKTSQSEKTSTVIVFLPQQYFGPRDAVGCYFAVRTPGVRATPPVMTYKPWHRSCCTRMSLPCRGLHWLA